MNSELKAACLAATLVGVWGEAAAQNTVSVVNLQDLSYATGLYQYNASGGGPDLLVTPHTYGDLAATTGDSPHDFDVADETFANPLNTSVPYTFAGVYDVAGGLVSIALNDAAAHHAFDPNNDGFTDDALDWDEVFSPSATGYLSEADFAAELQRYHTEFVPYAPLANFMAGYADILPRWNESSTLVNFSAATYGGSVTAQAVPEPASMAALGFGALALLRRRRR
ncbi:PEP-CTERM sorting domain-containing protein [bacterium]|nr:MAG: PEP-CTERM sorting domain-containing protein [bacterium]